MSSSLRSSVTLPPPASVTSKTVFFYGLVRLVQTGYGGGVFSLSCPPLLLTGFFLWLSSQEKALGVFFRSFKSRGGKTKVLPYDTIANLSSLIFFSTSAEPQAKAPLHPSRLAKSVSTAKSRASGGLECQRRSPAFVDIVGPRAKLILIFLPLPSPLLTVVKPSAVGADPRPAHVETPHS